MLKNHPLYSSSQTQHPEEETISVVLIKSYMENLLADCLSYLQTHELRDPRVLLREGRVRGERSRMRELVQEGTKGWSHRLNWPQTEELQAMINYNLPRDTFSLAKEAFFDILDSKVHFERRKHMCVEELSRIDEVAFSISDECGKKYRHGVFKNMQDILEQNYMQDIPAGYP
jgi:hypothetical protein